MWKKAICFVIVIALSMTLHATAFTEKTYMHDEQLYTEAELVAMCDQIMEEIVTYYHNTFPIDFTLAVEPHVSQQMIRVKYDMSHEAAVPQELVQKLERTYPLVVVEHAVYEAVRFLK